MGFAVTVSWGDHCAGMQLGGGMRVSGDCACSERECFSLQTGREMGLAVN